MAFAELFHPFLRHIGLHRYEILLANNLDQDTLLSLPVELAIEYLFPRAEIQFAIGDGNDNFAPHDLPFDMRVGVRLARKIMSVSLWIMGDMLFEPLHKVMMQPAFIVINENTRRNMHRVNQTDSFLYSTLLQRLLDLRCNVNEFYSLARVEPELFFITTYY